MRNGAQHNNACCARAIRLLAALAFDLIARCRSQRSPEDNVHFPNTPFTCFLVAAVLFIPTTSQAQACAQAIPPRHAWEVRQEVELVASTARFGPRLRQPTDRDSLPPNIIEFVVDTAGTPVASSFRVLRIEDARLVDAAREALIRWRFRPAQDSGCRVPQVTQWILRT